MDERMVQVRWSPISDAEESTMRGSLPCFMLSIVSLTVYAQNDTALIHIRLIDGQTGLPMKVQKVALEDRAGYRDISVRPDASGVATLMINRSAILLTHNTREYVNCGDEDGGLVHNDYKVSEILSTGVVETIAQPNHCTRTSGSAKSGDLILFVRPWRPGEDM
jgi:hypothetical protein